MMKQFTRLFVLLAMMMPLALLAQSYQSVPYFENFDSPSGSPELPAGWVNYQMDTRAGVGTFPCCYNYSSNARSGNYYFEMESADAVTELVATCEFANPAGLMLDFYYCVNSSYAPDLFEVGVMEDSTFVPVDTLTFTTGYSWNTYNHMRVMLNSYTGWGNRIAFRASKSYGQYTVFIDDMTISNIPSCVEMPGTPSAVVDSVSATLTWADANTSAGYFVYFNGDSSWYNTYTNSITFTGLTPNTPYSGYIFNSCNGSDTSEAVMFNFRTACGMPVFPMMENFDSYGNSFPSCWNIVESYSGYPAMANTAHLGGKSVEMYSYSNNISFATPYLYAPIETMETKFWTKKSSSYYDCDLVVGYTTNVSNLDSMVVLDTIAVPEDWTEYTISFANTNMTESGYIVFRKLAGGYGSVYIDEVTVREVRSCIVPENFAVTGTASGEMSFAWTDSNAYTWQIACGMPGMDPDTATMVTDFYETNGTVDNLADTLTYDFYLRADCGGEYSYWVGPITARPNLVPMRANATDTVRICGGTITDDGGLNGDFAANQTSYLVVYPSEEGKTIKLRGIATTVGTYTYYENTLTIYEGVGTSGRQLGAWSNTTNDSVNVYSTIGPLTIKFQSSYYSGVGYELGVECLDMANCVDPYDISVTEVAGASAVVNWNYGTATPADYFVITVTDTASGAVDTYTAADSARSYLISGLNQKTTYRVSVAAYCTTGDMSGEIFTYFTTNCYVGGELVVGDGNVGLTSHPFNSYYNYTICQAIYTNSEVATLTDTIYGIKIYQQSGPGATRNVDVYIDTTSKTAFADGNDFVVMDSSKLVFSGNVTFHNGWNELVFTTPWIRPSTSGGILLTFDDNTGSYSSNTYWDGTGNLPNMTLYAYQDGGNYDPQGPLSINTTTNRPNVMFMAPCADANCVAPNVAVGPTDSASITLNWVPGLSETEWTVEYKLHTDTVWTVATASTTSQTYTVSGLSPNTLYDFRVGSICLIDNVPFSYISARTSCGIMLRTSLPYVEGFESYGTGDVPTCWIAPRTGNSGAGTFPSCYNYSYNAHNGNIYFEVESSNGATEIFAMPAIDDVDGLSLKFHIATGGTYSPDALELGIWEGDTAFVVLDTVDLSDCSNIYNYVVKDMRIHYTEPNARIAMRASKSSSYTIFLDDFMLYVPNPCDSVINIVVDTITTDQIDIAWSDPNATGSYVVKVGTTSNPADATLVYTTTDTTYSITGLNASTPYFIFVYADCASGLSDVNGIVVATACDAINTFPWVEDFEGGFTPCYTQEYVSGSHSWVVTTTSSNPSSAHSGTQVASYTHTSSGTETMLVTPNFDFTTLANGAQVIFYHTQADWSGDQDELHVYYRTSLTGTWTLLQSYTSNIPNWTEENITLPNSAAAPFYQIGFKGVDSYGYGVKIDDITVLAASSCARPEALSANTTDVTAMLSWFGNSDEYQVEYHQVGDATVNTTSSLVDSVLVSGLTSSTSYQFRVRGICGTDTTLWSAWAGFTTAMCPNSTIAYSYDDSTMNAGTSNNAPVGNSYYDYGFVQTLIDSAQLAALGGDITAMAFNSVDGNQGSMYTNMDIYLANVSETSLSDFIIPDSTHNFVQVLTAGDLTYTDGGWHTFVLDTNFAWDGHSNILVTVNRGHGDYGMGANFRTHSTSTAHTVYAYRDGTPYDFASLASVYAYTGNFVGDLQLIACIDGCPAPMITGVTYDYESATLTWSGNGTAYEVAVKANDAANWPAETAVTGRSYTFTGLNAATAYTFRVRQDCSADENGYSNWTMGTFVTDSLPCFAPENLTVSNITNDGATFAWTAVGAETNWELHVWNTGVNDITVPVNTNPATVTGLVPGVTYTAAVRALCGSALVEGDWSETITFTTQVCPDVTGLATSNVTFNSVNLSWDNNSMAQSYVIEYGYQGFSQGQGTTVNVNTNSYQVTGLDDETAYDFFVRAVCGADWTSENWVRVTATTASRPDDVYTVTLNVNDPTMGTVTGAGQYAAGTTVTISASANDGYQFVNWSDGNTEATRQIVVNSDITLTATFASVQGIDEVNGVSCTIYPNPATTAATISVAGANGMVRISVVDMNGRVVATETLECAADCEKTMDVDNLAQGAYFVRITGENVNMVKKLVVR